MGDLAEKTEENGCEEDYDGREREERHVSVCVSCLLRGFVITAMASLFFYFYCQPPLMFPPARDIFHFVTAFVPSETAWGASPLSLANCERPSE